MRLLFSPSHPDLPANSDVGQELIDNALAAFYAHPTHPDGRPWIQAALITTLDGAAQGPDHRSGTLSSPGDRRVLALLRSLASVILVGAGTARTERYGPATIRPEHRTVRAAHGLPTSPPPIAVVSSSLDLPEPLLADPRTIVFTPRTAPAGRRAALANRIDVVVAGQDRVEPRQVVEALYARGHTAVLAEGGPSLFAELAAADLLDELCLTLSPLLLAGDALRGTHGPALHTPSGFTLAGLLEEDGYLFTRWLRQADTSR